jgi:hypothetical protein
VVVCWSSGRHAEDHEFRKIEEPDATCKTGSQEQTNRGDAKVKRASGQGQVGLVSNQTKDANWSKANKSMLKEDDERRR